MSAGTHRVVILGAGPAGVGAAYRLRQDARAEVTVLEQHDVPGGNAGSFEFGGMRVDFGSHRLHPACDPEILSDGAAGWPPRSCENQKERVTDRTTRSLPRSLPSRLMYSSLALVAM